MWWLRGLALRRRHGAHVLAVCPCRRDKRVRVVKVAVRHAAKALPTRVPQPACLPRGQWHHTLLRAAEVGLRLWAAVRPIDAAHASAPAARTWPTPTGACGLASCKHCAAAGTTCVLRVCCV